MCPQGTPTTGETPTLKAAFEHGLLLLACRMAALRCPHPSVDETVDGWTCRICGQIVD